MKDIVVKTVSIAALVVTGALSVFLIHQNVPQSVSVIEQQEVTMPEASPEPLQEPEVEEVVNEPAPTVQQPTGDEEPSNPYGWTDEDWACVQDFKKKFPDMFTYGGDDRANRYLKAIVSVGKTDICSLYEYLVGALGVDKDFVWTGQPLPPVISDYGFAAGKKSEQIMEDWKFYRGKGL